MGLGWLGFLDGLRKLEEKHKHAGKVLDNADVNLWEEKLHAEAGKNFAATGLSYLVQQGLNFRARFMFHVDVTAILLCNI